jgi:hypothetical protein
MTGRMTENTVHNQKNNREEEFLGVTAVRLDDNKSELILLDQTLLPNEKKQYGKGNGFRCPGWQGDGNQC